MHSHWLTRNVRCFFLLGLVRNCRKAAIYLLHVCTGRVGMRNPLTFISACCYAVHIFIAEKSKSGVIEAFFSFFLKKSARKEDGSIHNYSFHL
jgi:hypothetical protein